MSSRTIKQQTGVPQYLQGGYGKNGATLCTVVHGRNLRGNVCYVEKRFRLNIRRNFFHKNNKWQHGCKQVTQRGYEVSVLKVFRT